MGTVQVAARLSPARALLTTMRRRTYPKPESKERPLQRRRGGRSKPYVLEYRYTGKVWPWTRSKDREWTRWGRYETERGRDDAIKALAKNYWGHHYEFRKAD